MTRNQGFSGVAKRVSAAATVWGAILFVAGGCAERASVERAAAAKASKRPNVLVFFDDQLRPDACGVYGGKNITTPNIDRLAAQGAMFTNAISTCPLCTPFRGMLQTGRYPTHTGVVLNWIEINPRQRGIAHIFRDVGYHTGFIGKIALGPVDR